MTTEAYTAPQHIQHSSTLIIASVVRDSSLGGTSGGNFQLVLFAWRFLWTRCGFRGDVGGRAQSPENPGAEWS
jgi:hypothetical protein